MAFLLTSKKVYKMSNSGETGIEKAAKAADTVAENNNTTVELNDETVIDIYICKAKHVGVVLQAALSLMNNLGIKTLGELPSTDFTNPTVFLQLIAKSSEDVFSVAAELSSISIEDLLELELDDVMKIIIQVVTINKVFFLKKLLPMLPSGSLVNPAKIAQSKKRK